MIKRTAWNKGKKWSAATKKRISEAKKGTPAWNKGRPWSDKTKNKISRAKKGQQAWNKGRPWPTTTKKKISRAKLETTLDFKPFYKRNQPSKRLRFLVFKRDGFRCQYCGKTKDETVLEVDHKIPISHGGSNAMENLVAACIDCNRGKTDSKL